MKTDLVVANGELGLVVDANERGITVKLLARDYAPTFHPSNVRFVDVPVIKIRDEKERTKG